MKTTVELPDELLRAAQRTARREGTTVKSLLEEGLRLALARHLDTAVPGLRDASVDGNGLRPELGRDPQRGLRRPPVIAVDTNVLVYAHRRDSDFHRVAAAKVRELAEGRAQWALPWPCLHEFFSIVTDPRIYDPPSRVDQALGQIDAWLETASAVLLAEGETYWPRLRD